MIRTDLAFVFPGQASQVVGMGRSVAAEFPRARAALDEMDEALGEKLSAVSFEGPIEELTLTANAQPAILATSVAVARAIESVTDVRPAFVAGHSLGEYSALVAARSLDLASAVRLTRQRGRYMQEAVPAGVGAMAAVMGLDRATLEGLCAKAAEGEVVSPANFNAPGQIVIAGHKGAVERVGAAVAAAGGKAVPLKVSAPFHCALMRPAAERLAEDLERAEILAPEVPVITNVGAEPVTDPAAIRELLYGQVCSPVRWEDCVRQLAALGVKIVVEVGPGKVLQGLIKRIDKSLRTLGVSDADEVRKLASEGI
ncbi:MAG: ACP S-malonyltransferase [Deltaproteobacteria bacterium]|nr:ACP S-malonyltransferase [Deltaproteobacteria bacterium]